MVTTHGRELPMPRTSSGSTNFRSRRPRADDLDIPEKRMTNDYYDDTTDPSSPLISIAGMALLVGIPTEVFRNEIERQGGGAFQLPDEWARQGRRIAREAMAATGSESMKDTIDYLLGAR
jgi:hypothetical protein